MRPLRSFSSTDAVALATAATALALPPGAYGVVPDWWNATAGCVPELELEIWAPAALALTAAVLYSGRLHPLVVADQTTTFSASTNKATHTTHGLKTGDGPLFYTTVGGAQPPELADAVGYYAVYDAANTYKIATSRANALAGITIDLSTDGTGTTTASDSADTQRVYWETHDGLLGLAGDGAVSLAVQVGYSKRIPHSPRAIAYALVGTIDTGTLSAAIYPVQDRE